MDNILISIIVPAYNIEKYLGRCLDSILAQEHSNIEVIVVNDGSTDNTSKIIDQYAGKDSRIVPIHKKNGGVTSARLTGVQNAKGTYIGFVDGDDYIESDMYKRLLTNALKYDADISHCGYQMVFPSRVDYYYNTGLVVEHDNITGLKDLLEGNFVEPGLWNKLYNKSLFHNMVTNELMPTHIRINEDILMNYWLFKEAKTSIYEDFCSYHYILRKGSAATSKLNEYKLKNPVQVTRIILDDLEKDSEVYHIAEARLIHQLINIAVLPATEQSELIKPYRKIIRDELKGKLNYIVENNHFSKMLKLKAIWVSVFPSSYRWIHDVYAKIKGNDKKYNVE